ncbi:MAG TPA: ribonuclease P protein component [Stellaceae bacterium]|nr:ribonuclease P protein component [Stellaceae bacterium]
MQTPLGHLTERSEFLRVAASRRKWVTPGVMLQALRREGDPEAPIRIGFTASKKVGNAVIRNRARRRLREAVRQVMPDHAALAHDFVLVARAGTPERPWALLLEDLALSLRRVGAWRESADHGRESAVDPA